MTRRDRTGDVRRNNAAALPLAGEHVRWPAATPEQIAEADRVLTSSPPAKGLGRLRAAPGAEAVRQRTLAEQLAARTKARQAIGAEALPVRKGCRVRDAAGRTGTVVYCDVGVADEHGALQVGHVVRWANTLICEWQPRTVLVVQP